MKIEEKIAEVSRKCRGSVAEESRKSPGKSFAEDQFLSGASSRKSPGKSPAEESREEARNNTKE